MAVADSAGQLASWLMNFHRTSVQTFTRYNQVSLKVKVSVGKKELRVKSIETLVFTLTKIKINNVSRRPNLNVIRNINESESVTTASAFLQEEHADFIKETNKSLLSD